MPLGNESEVNMQNAFNSLSKSKNVESGPIKILEREVNIVKSSEGTIWFDFDDICSSPRSAADYIEIAKEFHNVLISNVPVITSDDQARRFISLIDECYDRKVKIIISTLITSAFGIFLYLTVTAPKSLAVLDYSAETSDLSNGEYIFTAAGCSGCHIEEGSKDKYLLAGGQKFETAFGTFKAPNISNSVEFGIGAWEFKDFYNALKLGQSPDGEHYFPTFPYTCLLYTSPSPRDS